MENLGKKVGYLKGLLEGVNLEERGTDGKLLSAIVDLLGDLSDHVESVEELIDELNDYVESIDDDLAELEGEADRDFEDLNDDADEYEDDMDSTEDQLHLLSSDDGDDAEAETLAGCVCPECGGIFFVSAQDDADEEYLCPHCEKRVTPDPLTPENAPVVRPEKE